MEEFPIALVTTALLATFDKLTIDPALESQLAHDSSSSSDINMRSVSTGGAPASSNLFLGVAGNWNPGSYNCSFMSQ
jgi:hypothetical protein